MPFFEKQPAGHPLFDISGSLERENRTAEVEERLSIEYEALERIREEPDVLPEEDICTIISMFDRADGISSHKEESPSLQVFRRVIDRVTSELGDDTLAQTFYRILPQAKRKKLKNAKAQYAPPLGEISLDETKLDERAMSPVVGLEYLAGGDAIPSFTTLHHEFIHSLQHDVPHQELKKIIQSTALGFFAVTVFSTLFREYGPFVVPAGYALLYYLSRRNKVAEIIIKETHAFIGSLRHGYSAESVSNYIEGMFEDGYSVKGRVQDMKKFYVAYDDIRRLYALGYSDGEIARVVKDARWSTKRNCYDTLEDEVKHTTGIQNYTESDVDNLVCAGELERARNTIRISRIAQEELRNYAESLS